MTKTLSTTRTETDGKLAPAYHRLVDELKSEMASGTWTVGAMLPSRPDLARRYGVSLTTVQQAVTHLIGEGILKADGGRGTFVAVGAEAQRRQADRPSGGAHSGRVRIPAERSAKSLAMQGAAIGIIDINSLRTHNLRSDSPGWIAAITTGLENALSLAGASAHYYIPDENATEATIDTAIIDLQSYNLAGAAIIGIYEDPWIAEKVLATVDQKQMPSVYISARDLPIPFPNVYYDSFYAGYQAAEHLIEQGYQVMGFCGHPDIDWSEQRLAGVEAAWGKSVDCVLLRTKDEVDDDSRRPGDIAAWLDTIIETMRLRNDERPFGVVAVTDPYAAYVVEAATARGLTMGLSYGLVGFDNNLMSRACGITTMRPPLEALGEQAAAILTNQLVGDRTHLQARLKSQLLPRQSTRRA